MIIREKKYGSIILIDALGTKARWTKGESHKIFEKWDQFLNLINDIAEKTNDDLSKNNLDNRFKIKIHSFSDTLLITISIPLLRLDDKEKKMFAELDNINFAGLIAANIFHIGLLAGFPFRGCISFGEFFENERTVAGEALIDAASYYEKPNWIGISLSPSAHRKIYGKVADSFVIYDVPLKNGIETNALAVDLHGIHNMAKYLEREFPKYGKFLESFTSKSAEEELIRMELENIDLSATLKIRNTLKFF